MSLFLSTAQPSRHPQPTARASSLSYLVFERPDLERAEAFLVDFGLVIAHKTEDTLYMRGVGPSHFSYRVEKGPSSRFVGAGFTVEFREELEQLGHIDEAMAPAPSPHPGGGEFVAMFDPSGFLVEVGWGQQAPAALSHRSSMPLGNIDGRARINQSQRAPFGPAEVVRLGHYVIDVADYQRCCAWYTRHLGLIPSDVQVFEDGSPALTFLRLDRGAVPTDHHSLAIAQGLMPGFGHAAFEVLDFDALGTGHSFLRTRGWGHAWGIGRHVFGSHIFDYWHDGWGARHEHYCDGDLFTAEQPYGVHAFSRESMVQWGPEMPRDFTMPKLSVQALASMLKNVSQSPDIDMAKLLALARRNS